MMQRKERLEANYFLGIVGIILLAGTVAATGTGCAGMTPPMGGPRDSLPPLIVSINPKDSTLNFTGKKIEIEFNEFVKVEDLQDNLIVSPTPKVNPTVEARLRTLAITIRDTLEENTTYALDFGKAIRDYNEGNILRGYRYIFSTGSSLDSLELGGRVIIANTGKVDTTMVAMLHTSTDDSAVVKERPRYVARLDSTGHFLFQNLSPGTYSVYALKDEGSSRRYFSSEQLFAFYDSTVTSQSQKKDIMLYAFIAEDTSSKSDTRAPAQSSRRRARQDDENLLRFQTNVGENKDLLTPLELTFAEPLQFFDSTKVQLTDTAFTPVNNYYFTQDTTGKKISIVYPWTEKTTYNLLIDTSFAEDTTGRRIARNDTINFQTKAESEYGLVRLRFLNLPLNRNPVLLFVQGDEIKHSHIFTNNQFNARLFPPGDYDLRLVFDENGNGKWDTGQFFGKRRQPEKVQVIPRKISVKPNWDTEVDIQL